MLTPELPALIANWIALGQQLRRLTTSLRFGRLELTPATAKQLQDAVICFDRNGNLIIEELLDAVNEQREPQLFPHDQGSRRESPPMVHDLPPVYQPDQPIGHLRDMAIPTRPTNVVPLRPAPKGGAR